MPEGGQRGPLPPGSTIGILGSGQLGRMLALAAARLGLKTHIYCEDSGPAFDVATRTTRAGFADPTALSAFAGKVDAVTYEFENVAVDTARHLAGLVPVRPGARALEVAQDRLVEKQFIAALGVAVAPFRAVDGPDAARRCALQPRRAGHPEDAAARLRRQRPGEPRARRRCGRGLASGSAPSRPSWRSASASRSSFPLWSCAALPASSPSTIARATPMRTASCVAPWCRQVCPKRISPAPATSPARIAAALDYVGVLAVEMFYLGPEVPPGERLMVNEIAPRVHNSGHWTIEACAISQFENHMRAVAGWPLGSAERHSDAEMVNLIGKEALDWPRLAAEPGACLHLYGKREARAGRKMGHVTRLFAKTAGGA